MGPWAPDNLKFMKDLGSRVSEATGEKHAKSFLFQSLRENILHIFRAQVFADAFTRTIYRIAAKNCCPAYLACTKLRTKIC